MDKQKKISRYDLMKFIETAIPKAGLSLYQTRSVFSSHEGITMRFEYIASTDVDSINVHYDNGDIVSVSHKYFTGDAQIITIEFGTPIFHAYKFNMSDGGINNLLQEMKKCVLEPTIEDIRSSSPADSPAEREHVDTVCENLTDAWDQTEKAFNNEETKIIYGIFKKIFDFIVKKLSVEGRIMMTEQDYEKYTEEIFTGKPREES